ncbi:hypothetical protein Celaphus_00010372, partial [Cervus elaphus hippelaphus]
MAISQHQFYLDRKQSKVSKNSFSQEFRRYRNGLDGDRSTKGLQTGNTRGKKPVHYGKQRQFNFLRSISFFFSNDPALQELESNFLIQQKLVEAAKKLANEPDLCKTVKKKRKQDYTDAVKKLQEIENAINEYRIRCGKKPSQKATVILPANDTFTLAGQRSSSVPHSPRILPPKSLGIERIHFRKSSINEQFVDTRQSREMLSTHSSPYKTLERRPQAGRSMPTTPVLTRNAYSSSHLEPEPSSQHCRQRSGSLESQSHLLSEMDHEKPFFSLSKSQRSSSTEILDDGSSYTSQTQITLGLSEYEIPAHSSYTSCYSNIYNPLLSPGRPYSETGQLDGTDGNRLEDSLESSEQRLFWHEDSKPGTLV